MKGEGRFQYFALDIGRTVYILVPFEGDPSIPEHGVIPWRTHRCDRGRRLFRRYRQSLAEAIRPGRLEASRTIREPEDLLRSARKESEGI